MKPTPVNTKNVCIVMHGHTDGANVNFMQQIAYDLNKANFQAAVMVRRGMETSKLTTPTLY